MRTGKLILFSIFLCMAAVGCKSQYEMLLSSNDAQAKYDAAFDLFVSKKYKKAATMFESLSMQTSGTEMDDTVRYYWALSNYKNKDYVTAEANFSSFVEMYARSPFTSEARFLRLDCMYRSTYRYELDQTPTNLAIFSLTEYMTEYPDSPKIEICQQMMDELKERLDRKEFENARIYYKMEDYIAAKTSLKNVLKDHPENKYREEVMYYLAKSGYKYAQLSVAAKQKDRYMDFVDQYFNFVGEYPDSRFRPELDQLYARYQRSAGVADLSRKTLKEEKQADKAADKLLKSDERALRREKAAAEKARQQQLK